MIPDYEYNELIRPSNLFKHDDEVKRFIKIRLLSLDAHIQALQNMIGLCAEDDCFEWCVIIQQEIDLLMKNQDKVLIPSL